MAKKFVIFKGIDNNYYFRIKKNETIESINITPTDTFVFKLLDIESGELIYTTNLTVVDSINGKIQLAIPSNNTTNLKVDVGDRCDYYSRKPTYKGRIEMNTADNGKGIAILDKIYVE